MNRSFSTFIVSCPGWRRSECAQWLGACWRSAARAASLVDLTVTLELIVAISIPSCPHSASLVAFQNP
jgi:hypothetical protein